MHNWEHEIENWEHETENWEHEAENENIDLQYKMFYYIEAQRSQFIWKHEDKMQLCTH